MTYAELRDMHSGRHKMPVATDFREAVDTVLRRMYPFNTSGNIAKSAKISKTKALNVLKRKASDRTITQIIRAGGWPLGIQVLEAIIGESLDAHLEREFERAKQHEDRIASARAHRAASVARHRHLLDRYTDRISS